MLSKLHNSLGFSLIEMMIAIAIVAITVVMGVPSYRLWIHNTEIRTAAESVQNGLQKARAEAVARNTNVAFALTGESPDWASSWQVSTVSPAALIESRSGNDGSKKVTARGYETNGSTTAKSITFNNLGGVAPIANTLRRVDFDSLLLKAGEGRILRVSIGNGGAGSNIRMCDPALAAGSSPRAC